ncbi:MAG: urease accessory protein UreE [Acidimicrobiales bacterium]
MLVVNQVKGNIHTDRGLALEIQRLEKQGGVEHVHIPFNDAGRRRLRITTDRGTPVGVDLPTDRALQDGDVLEGADGTLILIEVAPSEAMALRLTAEIPPEDRFEFGVRLGHMLGNQHWPITITDGVVLTPLSVDHKVMETVVRTHGFEGIEFEFVPVKPGEVPTAMPRIEHDHP